MSLERIDLHLHTTASDGTDSPAELVQRAGKMGLGIISVTDHDTVEGISEARAALPENMRLINGAELSSAVFGEGGFRCHILGYGFDPDSEAIRFAIREGIKKRREKLYARIDYIKSNFGISFSGEEISELEGLNSVSKLHIARLLIKHGYARSVGEAIDKYIGKRAPDDRIDAALATEAIISAGGVAVYAHPIGGEREKRLEPRELLRRAEILHGMGVSGLEAYYSRYTAADRAPILCVASELSMLVSAGSDYHGENKTVPLGCLDADGAKIDTSAVTLLEKIK